MSDISACSLCGGALLRTGRVWVCQSCHQGWREVASCTHCSSELEVLKACGAVDYFCPTCNSLQSRRDVKHEFCLCE